MSKHSLKRAFLSQPLIVFTLLLFLPAISCNVQSQSTESEMNPTNENILALGDSIMEWNRWDGPYSIPDVIGQTLNRNVVNVAVGGALFSANDPEAAEEGFDIRAQYRKGDWAWLVLDGGGNDFGEECGCGECRNVLNELISADGQSGEIPSFVRAVAESGTKVMYVGYARPPKGSEFEGCIATFDIFHARLNSMATSLKNVFFTSGQDVIDPKNIDHFDVDLVHPSELGSKLIGEHIANAILKAEAE